MQGTKSRVFCLGKGQRKGCGVVITRSARCPFCASTRLSDPDGPICESEGIGVLRACFLHMHSIEWKEGRCRDFNAPGRGCVQSWTGKGGACHWEEMVTRIRYYHRETSHPFATRWKLVGWSGARV